MWIDLAAIIEGSDMIEGVVQGREARVRLEIQGPSGRKREIEAIVDTGFTSWLTLPLAEIEALDLTWKSSCKGILADGSECLYDIYEVVVV